MPVSLLFGGHATITNAGTGEALVDLSLSNQTRMPNPTESEFCIHLDYRSDADLVALMILVEAIRAQRRGAKIDLYCPYLPRSREDAAGNGQPFPLRTVAQILNRLNFNAVHVHDVHSPMAAAVVARLYNTPLAALVSYEERSRWANYAVAVATPGQLPRAESVAQAIGSSTIIYGERWRGSGGTVFAGDIHGDVRPGANILIVDDICDTGSTAAELARRLRTVEQVGRIELLVTHGFFSRGYALFDGLIDHITAVNLVGPDHPIVTRAVKPVVGGLTVRKIRN